MQDRDYRQRFLFEQFPIRGELVHLNQSWQEILKRHTYPEPIKNMLGEMAAAAVLLSATLKFEGAFLLQIRGDGPLRMALIESTSEGTIRGLAQWKGDVNGMSFDELLSDATLAVTLDPKGGERYQGIVDLSSGSLSVALENYMIRSQQLDTRLWLTCNGSQASGMLLQKMPDFVLSNVDIEDVDAWSRVTLLANTIKARELSDLEFVEVLHRLFNEEDVRVFEKLPVSFRCSCSVDRVRGMLKMLGHAEVSSVLQTEGHLKVNCEFCNHAYTFDSVDVEEVFAIDVPTRSPQTRQ